MLDKCRNRESTCEKIWYWTMVFLLDQVLKRNGILPRIAHVESGKTTLQNKCCWNLQKVDILFSVPRLHCPGAFSRAKDVENCRYTSLQMWTQLIQFISLFFLSISSVSTGHVAAVSEEFESHQNRSGEPEIFDGSLKCS